MVQICILFLNADSEKGLNYTIVTWIPCLTITERPNTGNTVNGAETRGCFSVAPDGHYNRFTNLFAIGGYSNKTNDTNQIAVWQEFHSECAARFDKLSDRPADEESVALPPEILPAWVGQATRSEWHPSLKFTGLHQLNFNKSHEWKCVNFVGTGFLQLTYGYFYFLRIQVKRKKFGPREKNPTFILTISEISLNYLCLFPIKKKKRYAMHL